ncbi:phage tail tape measure protein [Streptomyces bacillaris]|uniref:phage tail tape measure protein n=1 Tax=Streptomyces bacillaris TaxID=68179 RepID=UPI0036931871
MTILDELLVRIGMDASGVDEGAAQVESRLEKMQGPAALAGAAAGGALALGLSAAMDITEARSSLRDQLGLTAEEAERAGSLAGNVYSEGFGGSLEEVTDSVAAVGSSISDLGSLTDTEVEEMSKSALALAKRFGVDVADAAGAVGKFIKTGLVADATEGFDLVTKAMSTVPKELRDDLLPTVQEYSTQFRRVGLDGATSFGLISQAVNAGARDLDQVADAIGQFGERALAGGTPVEDAFKSIGLDADKMAAKIGKGGKSAQDALQMTMDALRGTSSEQTKLNAAAALFGDPANVMGEALFALDPATAAAASGLDKAAGASKDLKGAMAGDPAQQLDQAMRTLSMGLGEALLPVILKLSEFMSQNKGLMQVLVPVVLGLALALGVFAAAVWIANLAMLASPVTWIVLGIIALIAVIALIILKWDEVAAATAAAWAWIVDKLGAAWQWIKDAVAAVWNWVAQKTAAAWNWIVADVQNAVTDLMRIVNWLAAIPGRVAGWFGQVVSWIGGLPAKIRSAASGMWDGISSSFRSMVNQLISGWNRLSFTIGGGSILGVSIPSITLRTPDIPYLAEGGITTGPTLAMIGEGAEDEVVLPLSRLDQMLDTRQDVRAPSVQKTAGAAAQIRVVYDASGGTSALRTALQEIVRIEAGGDVQEAFGQ